MSNTPLAAGSSVWLDSRTRRRASHWLTVCFVAMLAACGGSESSNDAAQATLVAEESNGRAHALAFGVGDTTDNANITVKALIPVALRRITRTSYEYD